LNRLRLGPFLDCYLTLIYSWFYFLKEETWSYK
jgi:hypothetical protein